MHTKALKPVGRNREGFKCLLYNASVTYRTIHYVNTRKGRKTTTFLYIYILHKFMYIHECCFKADLHNNAPN